ncbi:MAG TPA: hypothetical protein VMF90_12535 [Rhizobiaceae bacterium]|nr:hypothetical protein [Rhizobiaceae bacterium]
MTIHRKTLGKLAFSTFLVVAAFSQANAQDAAAVAERLKAVLAINGMELAWTGVTGDAASMVIEGTTLGVPGEAQKVPLGNVTLTDIKEENGGLVIGGVALPDYTHTEDGVTMDINGVTMAGIRLPAEGSTDPVANLMMYDTADVANISFKMGDKTAFQMTDTHFEVTPPADGKAMEFSGAAEKFTADLSLIEDPQSKPVIEALGYSQINGFFELEGSWNPSDGRMALSQYDITVENAGTYGMTFDLGGYTPEFIKQLQEMQKQIAAQPEGADSSAQGLAMLGLMQQLTFHSASIRWDDDSLTGKVLEFVGKSQGMSAADVANQAKAVVPFLLAQLNNPELTQQATAAVTKYLDDPQSLEIVAEPADAVPFALIMAGAMSPSPQDLVKTLGVTVEANDGE